MTEIGVSNAITGESNQNACEGLSASFSAACAADPGNLGFNHTLTLSNITGVSDGSLDRIRWSLCGNRNVGDQGDMLSCMTSTTGRLVPPMFDSTDKSWFCYEFERQENVPVSVGSVSYLASSDGVLYGANNATVRLADFAQCVSDSGYSGQLRAKANLLELAVSGSEFSTNEATVTLAINACVSPTNTPAPTPTHTPTPTPLPSTTPSPTPTPSPLACIQLDFTPGSPQLGTDVALSCEGSSNADFAEFQLSIDNEPFTEDGIEMIDDFNASFTVSEPGDYVVRCRVCNATQDGLECTNYQNIAG